MNTYVICQLEMMMSGSLIQTDVTLWANSCEDATQYALNLNASSSFKARLKAMFYTIPHKSSDPDRMLVYQRICTKPGGLLMQRLLTSEQDPNDNCPVGYRESNTKTFLALKPSKPKIKLNSKKEWNFILSVKIHTN